MRKSLCALALVATLGMPGWLHAGEVDTRQASGQIDTLLAADWKKNSLQPNPPAGDAVFVRRIYLDVVGRIPTYRETEEFLNSKDSNKRAALIDKLLASDGYEQHFFNFWADILRAQSRQLTVGGITGITYMKFIKDSLRDNKPYDQFVRELVSAQGKAWDNGAIGYYLRDRDMPLDNMAITVRIFLGTRLECAQCHNHPSDKWTQMQFFQMAAFTYGVESNDLNQKSAPMKAHDLLGAKENEIIKQIRKANGGKDADKLKGEMKAYRASQQPISLLLRSLRGGQLQLSSLAYRDKKLQLPHDYQYDDAQPKAVVKAATMMGKPADSPPGAEGMKAYAEWMTARENSRFTTVVANRLWKKVFGLGLIEPVDELKDDTVAMNPELMAYLDKYMRSVNYDMKAYLRALLNTQTYQRSVSRAEVPAGVAYHFTGPVLRRMSAEQIWDSLVTLANPTPDRPNLAAGEDAQARVMAMKKRNDALEALTPEELLKGVEDVVSQYRPQLSRMGELRKAAAVANAKGDKDKERELYKKIIEQENEQRRISAQAVNELIYVPAVQRLAANVSGQAKTEATSGDATIGAPFEIRIPGYDKPKKTDQQLKAELETERKALLDEAAYYGVPAAEQEAYLSYRRQQGKWLRSGEIGSPAPPGHPLRAFGQSDRVVVENANADASMPQAMAMMNSLFLQQFMAKYSPLMLAVNKAKSADDKVKAVYLTLLSREPTDNERRVWREAQGNGLTTEDLIYALLNTKQFIFIQ